MAQLRSSFAAIVAIGIWAEETNLTVGEHLASRQFLRGLDAMVEDSVSARLRCVLVNVRLL